MLASVSAERCSFSLRSASISSFCSSEPFSGGGGKRMASLEGRTTGAQLPPVGSSRKGILSVQPARSIARETTDAAIRFLGANDVFIALCLAGDETSSVWGKEATIGSLPRGQAFLSCPAMTLDPLPTRREPRLPARLVTVRLRSCEAVAKLGSWACKRRCARYCGTMHDGKPVAAPLAKPTVVAIDMGYGHLRPARAIATMLGCPVLHADQPPLADADERERWATTRRFYETMSRISAAPWVGKPFRGLLNAATSIPHLHPFRDLSGRTIGVRLIEHSARSGLGRSMVAHLQESNSALVTTFYSPALLADFHGYDRIYCVVTDSDVNRVWAPIDPHQSKIQYLAPSGRVVRRLRAYGVSKDQVELTGFPLPHSLLGGSQLAALRANLLPRLVRLDQNGVFRHQFAQELEALGALPEANGPPHLAFAVGGAGAQADISASFLPSLRDLLTSERLRLTLVAGVKRDVRDLFELQLQRAGLAQELGRSVRILYEPNLDEYFDRFDALLAHVDILWTKPSELTFYGALGLALVFAPPIGVHEDYNQRWALENGAGLKQRDPSVASDWLGEWLSDGTLAAAAWAAHKRLPCRGLYRILERLGFPIDEPAAARPHSENGTNDAVRESREGS
jgi:hypothetical protein